MKIEDRMHSYEVGKQAPHSGGKEIEDTAGKNRTNGSSPTAAIGQDTVVQFSQTSKEVHMARSIIEATPDVRSEKVATLKESIQNGAYSPNPQAVADKLVDSLLSELI